MNEPQFACAPYWENYCLKRSDHKKIKLKRNKNNTSNAVGGGALIAALLKVLVHAGVMSGISHSDGSNYQLIMKFNFDSLYLKGGSYDFTQHSDSALEIVRDEQQVSADEHDREKNRSSGNDQRTDQRDGGGGR